MEGGSLALGCSRRVHQRMLKDWRNVFAVVCFISHHCSRQMKLGRPSDLSFTKHYQCCAAGRKSFPRNNLQSPLYLVCSEEVHRAPHAQQSMNLMCSLEAPLTVPSLSCLQRESPQSTSCLAVHGLNVFALGTTFSVF